MIERLRPWLWAAWWTMAVGGVGISLLPAAVAAPLYHGLLAGHFWPFAILAVTGTAAARPGRVWRVLAGMAAIAVGIELAQIWIPGRACEWLDLRDDGMGMAAGWAVAWVSQLAAGWRRAVA